MYSLWAFSSNEKELGSSPSTASILPVEVSTELLGLSESGFWFQKCWRHNVALDQTNKK